MQILKLEIKMLKALIYFTTEYHEYQSVNLIFELYL